MAKKIGPPPKSDRRVESHVQPPNPEAAPSPEQAGAPTLPSAVIAEAEGLVSRDDLLAAEGMTFGDFDRKGVPPKKRSSWTPTSM
jgi:hypothetical protein